MHWTTAIIRACSWSRRNGLPYRVNHTFADATLRHTNVWRRPPTVCERLLVAVIWLVLLALVFVVGWSTHTIVSYLLIH